MTLEILMAPVMLAAAVYVIWQQVRNERLRASLDYRTDLIIRLTNENDALKKRNASLAFALYGKQEIEKIEGESHV